MHKIRSTFTVSDFIIDELESVAKELNEKKSHIVEKALSMYFDALDEKLSDQRLKNFLDWVKYSSKTINLYMNIDNEYL